MKITLKNKNGVVLHTANKYCDEDISVGIEAQEVVITPSKEEQIKEGLLGKVTVPGVTAEIDENIVPENIKEGTSILGVEGGYKGIDTSDATALSEDILQNKTAYVNNEKITGTMQEYDGSYTGNTSNTNYNATINPEGKSGLFLYKMLEEVDFKGVPIAITINNFVYDCIHLKKIKGLNAAGSTTLHSAFTDCNKLEEVEIFNTDIVNNFYHVFYQDNQLHTLSAMQADSVTNLFEAFYNCTSLENFGGLINLGKGYKITTANQYQHSFKLEKCTKLTHESLMNVINGLYDLNLTYDVANGGTLYRQTLELGKTNLAKLTADEIAIATNKGWDVK